MSRPSPRLPRVRTSARVDVHQPRGLRSLGRSQSDQTPEQGRGRGAAALALVVAAAIGLLPIGQSATAQSTRAQSAPVSATTPATTPTTTLALPSPVEYATKAFDFIERYGLRRKDVDWAGIRQRAEERVLSARTIADTYPVIADTLKALGDRHSSFQRPPDAVLLTSGRYSGYGFTAVWPQRTVVTLTTGGPAALAGLRLGDRIDLVDGRIQIGRAHV